MKIAFITPHTNVSGGVKVIFRFAQGLSEKGHDVHMIAHKYAGDLSWLNKKLSFEITKLPEINKYNMPKVDCVISFCDGTSFAPVPNIPNILLFQGFGTQQYDRECINMFYPYNGVIATSKWLANMASKFGHKKIYVVPPGVDTYYQPVAGMRGGVPIVGCLWHDAPKKNSNFIVGVMNYLVKSGGKAKLLLISAKVPESFLIKEKFSIFEEARFPYSFIINPPQQVLPSIYSSCSVWASVSLNEGFGLTTLEAMACGVPVVYNPSYGLDDYLIDGKNCYIADEKEIFTRKIMDILGNTKVQESFSNEGKALANKFNWKVSVDNFEKAIVDILK